MQHDGSPGTPPRSGAEETVRPGLSRGMTPVLAGIVAGIHEVGFSIALAALMFAGPLAGGLGIAASAALLATAILGLALGAKSGLRGNLGHVQDIGVAVLAPALAAMATTGTLAPETAVATAFAIVAVSSLATGALMYVTGRLGLGRMVRFFPQTVVAGFLAGTGWLLLVSGIAVAADLPMAELFDPTAWSAEDLARVVAVVALALALWLVLPRLAHPAALVLVLVAGVAIFHGVLAITGTTAGAAQVSGWLPEVPATGNLIDLARLLPLVDWPAVAAALPVVGIVAVLSLVACLMNTSALEVVTGQDADQNAELRVTGLANIACGAVAGPPGYAGLASSLIAHRASPGSRSAAFVMAAVAVLGLFAAGTLVATIPVFVTSGLIVYLGLDLLRHWLVATRRRFSTAEWAIVVVIVVVVAIAGFAAALVVGLVIGVAVFVYSYAQVQVLRGFHTLDHLRSTVERDPKQVAMLRESGAAVAVFELQGFLFFGTAERLRTRLKERLDDPSLPTLRRLILDFRHVSGMDSAALALIERIAVMTAHRRIDLVLSGAGPVVAEALDRASPAVLRATHLQRIATLDEAVEAAEEMLLGAPIRSVPPAEMAARYALTAEDAAQLTAFFESLPADSLPRGSRLLTEGDPADGILLLEEGRVTVMRRGDGKGPPQRLRAMGAGAVLGDIGFAAGAKRTADVVAESAVVVRRIPAALMKQLEREDTSLALALSRMVVQALAAKVVTANRVAGGMRS